MNFFWSYNNGLFTPIKYGKQYNWFAVVDSRGIAPAGWHVATNSNFSALETAMGGASVAGNKLREAGFAHWDASNGSATNSSGFTAVGSGRRVYSNGTFAYLTALGELWSSSEYDTNNAISLYLQSSQDYSQRQFSNKKYGFGVRCMKDDSTDPGSVTDNEGNVYETVKIGTQVWMKSNLMTGHYNNGDTITNITDNSAWVALTSGAWCYYDNDSANQ